MLMNTHKIMAQNIIGNLDRDSYFLINEKHFIWGNLKPDMLSKYKLIKHYMDETLDVIIKKIEYLSSLTLSEVTKWYPMSSFNQELGVICHFLSDFFCVPHHQRWEFKHSMNKHIKYERELDIVAKEFKASNNRDQVAGYKNVKEFIYKLQEEYKSKVDYTNDLNYATYVCNSVVNYILDSIVYNSNTIKISAV